MHTRIRIAFVSISCQSSLHMFDFNPSWNTSLSLPSTSTYMVKYTSRGRKRGAIGRYGAECSLLCLTRKET